MATAQKRRLKRAKIVKKIVKSFCQKYGSFVKFTLHLCQKFLTSKTSKNAFTKGFSLHKSILVNGGAEES